MKKLFLFSIIALTYCIITIKSLSAQPAPSFNIPPLNFDGDLPDSVIVSLPAANCSPSPVVFPFYDNIANYIPGNILNDTLTKTVQLAFNIFQKSDGSGNYQNNNDPYIGKPALLKIIPFLNANFANSDTASDPVIPKSQEMYNRRIRFSIGPPGQERIYFYQKDTLQNANCNLHRPLLIDAVYGNGPQADPARKKYLNIFFTEGAVCGGVNSSNITITSGGSGYTSPPAVTFSPAGATGIAIINGGAVIGISITSPGCYYYPPTITFSGGGGSGASAVVNVLDGGASGCANLPTYGDNFAFFPTDCRVCSNVQKFFRCAC